MCNWINYPMLPKATRNHCRTQLEGGTADHHGRSLHIWCLETKNGNAKTVPRHCRDYSQPATKLKTGRQVVLDQREKRIFEQAGYEIPPGDSTSIRGDGMSPPHTIRR